MDSHPLDFEKPILELQRRLQDLKNHSDQHDLDFDSEVEAMETKIRETRRQIYDNLTAWQRVQLARHIQRPFALDYVARCFTNWIELHGDRVFGDDKAMPSGLAKLGPHHRSALTLRYLDGLSVPEVADHLGRTVHATEALLVRARNAFRAAYPEGRTDDV